MASPSSHSTRPLKRDSTAAGFDSYAGDQTPGAGPSMSKLARLGVEGGAYGGIAPGTNWDAEVATDADPVDLEAHRKSSIYLSLLHYRALSTRQSRDLAKLVAEREALEGSLCALEGCWGQLTSSIRDALHRPAQPPEDIKPDLQNDASLPPHLSKPLESYLPEGLSLVTALTKALEGRAGSGGGGEHGSGARVTAYVREISVLKATIATLRTSLHNLQASERQSQEDLVLSERKHDKFKLEFDKLSRANLASAQAKADSDSSKAAKSREVNGNVKREPRDEASDTKVDDRMNVDQLLPNGYHVNGGSAALTEEHRRLQEKYAQREARVQAAEEALTEAIADRDFYQDRMFHPTDEIVQGTKLFKDVQVEFEDKLRMLSKLEAELQEARAERDGLRDGQEAFRESLIHEADVRLEHVKGTLRERDKDAARLRGQRDTYKEHNDSLRAQQASASHHVKEITNLTQMREMRLKVLSSEVKRLRGKTASTAGEEDYLDFLLSAQGDLGEDPKYARHLESQLRTATDLEAALQAQVVSYAQGSADKVALMAAETRARKQAAEAQRLLEERIALVQLGPHAQLLQQLEAKEKATRILALQLKDAEASLTSLYTEVDVMAKAFDASESKLKDKVFDLKRLEDAVAHESVLKGKADHKYFGQCRVNEGLVLKQSLIETTIGMQRDAIAKAREVESGLHAQLSAQEKEMTLLKNALTVYEQDIEKARTNSLKVENERDVAVRRAKDIEATIKPQVQSAMEYKHKWADAQETIEDLVYDKTSLQASLDKTKARLSEMKKNGALPSGSGGTGGIPQEYLEAKEQATKLMTILRCHTCEIGFKTKILAPCLHTFCAKCIDDRVKARNRNCPYCRAPFAVSDVKDMSQN